MRSNASSIEANAIVSEERKTRRRILFRVRARKEARGNEDVDPASRVRPESKRAIFDACRRHGSLTVGDASAATGTSVSEARRDLLALAKATGGTLEVDEEGEIRVRFPKDVERRLRNRSLWWKTESFRSFLIRTSSYLVRIAFGASLLASMTLVYLSIQVLSAQDRDDRRPSNASGLAFRWTPYDLWWHVDPYAYQRRRWKERSSDRKGTMYEMGFLESLFSFVFGDGDASQQDEERRWKEMAETIRDRGGVLISEEIALHVEDPNEDVLVGESHVIPALIRFEGVPTVDEEGRILYTFPTLQSTSKGRSSSYRKRSWKDVQPNVRASLDTLTPFSKATSAQQFVAVFLGIVNALGVAWLSILFQGPRATLAFGSGTVRLAWNLLPFLQLYAISFLLFPALRWIAWKRRNDVLRKRNERRKAFEDMLKRPGSELRAKLQSARSMSETRVFDEKEVVYRTDKDVLEQQLDELQD